MSIGYNFMYWNREFWIVRICVMMFCNGEIGRWNDV